MTMMVSFALLFAAIEIFRIISKESEAPVITTGNDVVHPAEFEMRDHYFMRCSE